MTPLTFNALLAVLLLLAFFLIGAHHFRQINTYDSYYLRKRNLTANEYASSFSASSTSLATVLIWFVTFSPSEGLLILYAPITYLIGAWAFTRLTPILERHRFFETGRTLGGYIYQLYENRLVSLSISAVASVGLLSILLIELYIGATIFSIYVSGYLKGAVPVGVALVGLTVFVYTALGGFPGVVRSDHIQLALIWVFAVFGLAFLWLNPPTEANLTLAHFFPQRPFAAPQVANASLPEVWRLLTDSRLIISLPLAVNLLFVNILYYPAQLARWQMAAASASGSAMKDGLIRGGIATAVLWSLFALFGILIGVHYPGAKADFNQILLSLASADTLGLSYVLFPLLFVACLAALVSTADSAIIPIAQTITDDYVPARYRTVLASRLAIMFLLAFTMLLYYLVFVVLGYSFFHVLFTLFGLLIALSPAILFAMFCPTAARTRRGQWAALGAIWVGLGVALFLSYLGSENLAVVLYSGPAGVLVGAAIIMLAHPKARAVAHAAR